MLKIRLRRIGKTNQPYFAIVVAEHYKPVKGKFIEKLGSYDPRKKTFSINAKKVEEWRAKGAQFSDTVHNLLVKNKIIKDKPIKKTVKPKVKKEKEKVAPKIQKEQKEGGEEKQEDKKAEE